MLDAPIRLDGRMIGVICNEHVGAARKWTSLEANFVANVSDILARAFQAHQRLEARMQLEKLNSDLELLVKQRTNELQSLHAKTVESAKFVALGEMAGGIAHEINSPLGLILVLADQISESDLTANNIEDAKESAKLISATVLRISKIIKGLKTFSRDGSQDAMGTFSLVEIAEETLLLCSQRMNESNIKFEFVKPASGHDEVVCQSVQISQVMLNLLNNAFDAVRNQTAPWIRFEIKVEAG